MKLSHTRQERDAVEDGLFEKSHFIKLFKLTRTKADEVYTCSDINPRFISTIP